MTISQFNVERSALVLIDITKGFLRMPIFGNDAETTLANALALADGFRSAESLVVLTSNAGRPGGPGVQGKGASRVGPPMPVERDMSQLMAAAREPDFGEIASELLTSPNDFVLRKHSWGAFFATDLDLQLRRLGVQTIVLGGISSNFGVESTGREAKALGYNVVFVVDAMRALTQEEHDHSVKYIFPMIGQVTTTKDVLAEISGS